MNDPQYEIRLWMQRQLDMKKHGTKSQLARFLNVRPDAITRMANTDPNKETRDINIHELRGMERFFGASAPDMPPPLRMVPIKGLVGASPDGTVLYTENDLGEIQAPDDEETVAAVEVRGDSMHGVVRDGWIVFYEDPMPWHESMVGELCVCFLADGRVLLKIPYPSKAPGFFDLESASAPIMRDVVVERFGVVTDIKTRKAASRYARRYPEKPIPELPLSNT